MTKEIYEQLTEIFNALSTLEVKGENVLILAECLINLHEILEKNNNED
jgi:hypothetical protein